MNGAPPAPVEEAKLKACFIGQKAHQASQRVDLPDKVALGQASDGRIAGHLGNCLEVDGDQAGFEAHGADRGGGLAAGMAGPDHDDIEAAGEFRPGHYFPTQKRLKMSFMTSSARISPVRRPIRETAFLISST